MSDNKEKEYMIELSIKIAMHSDKFPDDEATSIVDKIKTKVFCNREFMSLVGLRTDVYEVCDEED